MRKIKIKSSLSDQKEERNGGIGPSEFSPRRKGRASPYHMDDQQVSEDARKNQEPKQDRVHSEDLGHGTFSRMASTRV